MSDSSQPDSLMCAIHVFEFDPDEAGCLAAAAGPRGWPRGWAKPDNKHDLQLLGHLSDFVPLDLWFEKENKF